MNQKTGKKYSNTSNKWKRKGLLLVFLFFCTIVVNANPHQPGMIYESTATPTSHNATADELVYFTNLRRTQYGLPALTVNSTLMSIAQETANIMASQQLSWHIGGVSERLSQAGYGSGVTVWATENIANGTDVSAEELVYVTWNDDIHNIPVMNPIYCDIGAGVATDSEGTSYYVIHAAYTEKRYCGEYRAPDGTTLETIYANQESSFENEETAQANEVSQYMQPVSRVTPNEDGQIIHEVTYGQTLWSIAIAYGTKIKEIQALNGMAEDDQTVYPGQFLVIPTSLTPYPIHETPQPVQAAQISPSSTLSKTTDSSEITPTIEFDDLSDKRQEKTPVSTIIFWIAVGGLLLVLFGILSRFLPAVDS